MKDSSMPLWGAVLILVCILLTGILYGFASAVQYLSLPELEKKAAQNDKKAVCLKKLMGNPSVYINAIPLMIITSGVCFGSFLLPSAVEALQPYISHVPALVLACFVTIVLLAAFGVLTFRRIGAYYPLGYAYKVLGIVRFTVTVLLPFTLLVTWMARLVARVFGVELANAKGEVTEEEILSVVGEAHEQGVIEKNEADMIQNIISFHETTAKEIMTHRSSVTAFEVGMSLNEVLEIMLEKGNSRYPVYKEDFNNIRGLIHYKDLSRVLMKNPWAGKRAICEIPGLIRQAGFIPETQSIGSIFKTMQAKQEHLVIVVDEYGQTSGLVSMEDILEEIVGDILDEYDEGEYSIKTQTDNSVVIEGMAYLEDVEEELGIHFPDVEFETLNGYLTYKLGHIPTEKDIDTELVANGCSFQILSIERRTIAKVRAEKIKEKETKGEKKKCQDIQNSRT